MDEPASPRDDKGRFGPGNPGGPGRPRGARERLQQAAEDAISTDHVHAMLRKALMLALQGNLTAMRLVLDRTCGRSPEASTQGVPLDFTLPKLQTVADCTAAIDRLLDAACQGIISLDTAKVLVDMIAARVKAIEVNDLETRLIELEKAAASVELPGSRGMRRL